MKYKTIQIYAHIKSNPFSNDTGEWRNIPLNFCVLELPCQTHTSVCNMVYIKAYNVDVLKLCSLSSN